MYATRSRRVKTDKRDARMETIFKKRGESFAVAAIAVARNRGSG